MPELPEVETIACGLRPEVAGRIITSAQVHWPGSVRPSPERFTAVVTGRRIEQVRRRAKLLLLDLGPLNGDSGRIMAFHLKMTGRLYLPDEPDVHKHSRIVFTLDSGRQLHFEDVRKFGYCRLFHPDEIEHWDFWASLGPEPLEIDEARFVSLFEGRNARIKSLLLNQAVIAGIGNIYADESLFRAGIRPETPASKIPRRKLARLHGEVQAVLSESIRECGSSIRDYRDARGNAGAFQNSFRVYGRGGEACVTCGRTLEVAKVAGRTSVFCRKCQK